MRTETISWIDDAEQVKVFIGEAKHKELHINIGWPSHTVYFMDEKMLDQFTDNLLKAKLEYIQEGKK